MQHFQRMEIIRNLGNELASTAWHDDVAFKDLTKQIVEGKGINHKYLNFPDDNTKYAFNFFTQAFTATLTNDTQLIEKYNKYYSNSYGQFCQILNNLKY